MKKHVLALSLLAVLVNFSSCTNETKNKDEKDAKLLQKIKKAIAAATEMARLKEHLSLNQEYL